MSITVGWGDEDKTIIHMLFEQDLTLDDYLAASREAAALLDSVEHQVDMILELKNVTVPKNILAQFPQMKAGPHVSRPNFRFGVIVGASGFAETLLNIYARVFMSKSRYTVANTLEEAYAAIKEHRGEAD